MTQENGSGTAIGAGQVAIVTGGARGIGIATATLFAQRGYTVVVADIDGAAADEAARGITAAGLRASAVRVDVGDRRSVEAMIQSVIDTHGQIDVMVNNAGIAGNAAPIAEVTDDDWEMMLRVDLTSVFLCCRAVMPHMLSRQKGTIVNVASIAGKEGNPTAAHYSASKAGLIGFTKSLAKELAPRNVVVNCITPAAARTEIFSQMKQEHVDYMLARIPMGRFLELDEVAALICWLASEDCSFSTGAVFDISGGRATY